MSEFKYIVTAEDVKRNLSVKQLVRSNFTFSSRLMTKLKQNHLVSLNGGDVQWWIAPVEGDVISILLPEEKSDFPPEDIPISAVYEDDDLLVINKQPGVVVHPTKGKPCHTIANGLMKKMLDEGKSYKIRFVNRLDMKYKAIVVGEMPEDSGTIDLPLGRPNENEVERWVLPVEKGGYPSVTHYKVLDRFGGYSLVELELETGRTHQIRVHLSYIGYPILGDHLYCHGDPRYAEDYNPECGQGGKEIVSDLIDRQALHAFSLTLRHPVSDKELHLEAPLPADMQTVIERLKTHQPKTSCNSIVFAEIP